MEAITRRFASIVLLLSLIALTSASVNTDYGKTKPEGYLSPKFMIPKEEPKAYEKSNPKIPTKVVIPKEEPKAYEKSNSKIPTKVVIPKEHEVYEKSKPKIPTKVVVPKEHEVYEKSKPKIPTKPVMPKEEQGAYPKIPTKPMTPKEKIPKETYEVKVPKETYTKSYPEIPIPKKALLPKVPEHPKNIAIQGLIYCIYGSKLIPLKGATARVTCLAVHKNGHESAPFSFSSCPADKNGYFLAKISPSKYQKEDVWELTECKAFLEKSPWEGCKVPEDTNGGTSGARLTYSRLVNGYRLSSVGPFIYNAKHPSSPKEGY